MAWLPAAVAWGGGCDCCAVAGSTMGPTASSSSSSKVLPNAALLAISVDVRRLTGMGLPAVFGPTCSGQGV